VLMYNGRELPQRPALEYRRRQSCFWPNLGKTLLWCLAVFVILPAFIYYLSYLPVLAAVKPANPVSFVLNDQVNMYDYHSRLTAGHPFSSSWWQWPFMIRPMWYYSGHEQLPSDMVSSIAAFGNPAVWWVGAVCLVAAAFIAVYKRDGRALFIIIAFLSQYLPWIIIPRELTFIYHFFTSVPFLVFCIVYVLIFMVQKIPRLKYAAYAYLVSVPALFVMFYPVLSGLTVPKAYVASVLRWFTSWVFYV
jgi:dolichyl-phosphate-mannose-protein mannosyltransferase